ncbi:MAG: hypothetical protein JST75_05470 [Bacteroidetes bacterium]|nr:hypothetical protein [Bacteroidota bacterium]
MTQESFDISPHSDKNIDADKLLDYLNDRLPAAEKNEIEKLIAGNDFVNDAIEGLKHVKDKKKLQAYVDQLNQELHNHLQKKKLRREKKRLPEYSWIYITIILILSICILGYLVIRQFLH